MSLDEPGYPLWLPRWCPYSSGYHPQPWKHPWALLKIPSIKRMTNTLMLFGSVLMLPSPPELHWSMWFIASGFICRFFPFEQLVCDGFSIIDIEPKTCFSKASFFRSAMANLSNMLAKVFFSFSCILILLHSMTEGCQVHLSIHLLSFNFLLALGDLVLGSLFQKVCSQYSALTQNMIGSNTLFSGSNWNVFSKSAFAASQSLRARCASPKQKISIKWGISVYDNDDIMTVDGCTIGYLCGTKPWPRSHSLQ